MPLVKRKVEQKIDTTHGKMMVDHIFFVPVKQRRPTDEVVEPSAGQLADLAYRMPAEPSGIGKMTFLQLAKARKVRPYEPPLEEPVSQDAEALTAGFNALVTIFPGLKDKDALELVDKTHDATLLKALFQAELDTETPRVKVVAAFKAKGLKIIEPPEEVEDQGEPGQGEA